MQFKTHPRTIYQINPLVEVVCQIRFDRVLSILSKPPSEFQDNVAAQYPKYSAQPAQIIHIGPPSLQSTQSEFPITHNFTSIDDALQISLNADSLSLTSKKYKTWETFSQEFFKISKIFNSIYPPTAIQRLGLRYKDLIERESLGLAGVPWGELLAPPLIGPFSSNTLFEAPLTAKEEGQIEHTTQTIFKLGFGQALLQATLLRSTDAPLKRAFLIDTDFSLSSSEFPITSENITQYFDKLHESANSLFRSCLMERLHNALKPNPN